MLNRIQTLTPEDIDELDRKEPHMFIVSDARALRQLLDLMERGICERDRRRMAETVGFPDWLGKG